VIEMLYNPAQMDKEELYATFVAREKLLLELLETIEDNTGKKSIQHIILLGARGIGKTHMLRIMENKVLDSHNLQSKWITVNVPEEQYGVFGLMDFFEYILKIIFHSSQLEKTNRDTYHKELEEIEQYKNKESLDKIVSILKDISQKENKQFLLLIDNIDKILAEKIREEKELEYLRSVLMTENFSMIVGTSTSIFEEIALYDKAFFRFFKTIHLQSLNNKEVEKLLLKRAKFDQIDDKIKLNENKNKINAITDLTGGYPRLILMLYEIIEDKPLLDVLKTFNRLLDNLTPYYKHRMDDLAPQQQKIIDTIMLSDGVASPTDVAKMTGWKPNVITSQFKRLKDLNILQIKEAHEVKKKKTVYEISDRLFVIWYQMRYLGVLGRRIEYIVTFLKIWYDLGELKDKISSYASQYQHHYSMGNFSESYGYARSISIISSAITEVSEKEKIIPEQIKRYIDVGKFEDALKELTDLLTIHAESGNREGIASDYGNIGIVYQIQGDMKKALEHYEKALKIDEEIGNKQGMANQLGNMGNVYRIQGNMEKALKHHEKALEIHEKIGDKQDMASNLGNMGIVYQIQGNMEKALEHHEKALEIHEKIGNKQGMASDLGNMGIIYQIRGDMEKALEHHEKALEIDEKIGNKQEIASDLGNMGNIYQIQGDMEKALEHYEKALEIHEKIGNKQGIASDLGNIGNIYSIQGNMEKTLEHYEKALEIDEKIGNKQGIASDLGNIGNVYRIQGDMEKALEHYEKALEIDEKIGNKQGIASDLGNIGNVYRIHGDMEKAREHHEKALEIDEKIGNKQEIASDLGNMGNVYQIQGDMEKAREYHEKALEIHDEIGDKQGVACDLGNMGNVYRIQKDMKKALEHHEKALEIFKEIGDKLNFNIINNYKINLLLISAITHNKEKNTGLALEDIEAIVKSLKEAKDEDTIKIIVSSIFELLKDSEYDFAITIMEILQKEHKAVFEICEPFLISAKYLKTNDPSILENTSSIVLEGVKKILEAVEKQKNEMNG